MLETASYCHETDYDQRHNVLLVGDSLGDLHMSDGCVCVCVCMYVGFHVCPPPKINRLSLLNPYT